MSASVDYIFGMNSPWAFLGHDPFMDMATEFEVSINYRPVRLGIVFAETGGLPLPKRHPARQYYRMVELQRWREQRGLDFNLRPKFFPFDSELADRTVIAICETGQDPAPFMALAFRSVWEREENLEDADIIGANLQKAGLKDAAMLDAARSEETGAIYDAYTQEVLGKHCVGSPCYVLNGEPFWGQDRLDLLARALESGREPFTGEQGII